MKICLSCEGVSNTGAARCGHCGAVLLDTDDVHFPERRGEADAGNPLLGTVVDGKYRLQAVLGRGGLGTVFRAAHTGSLLPVAIKLLHPRFSSRPEYRRALLAEARRAAVVAHERCARLLDVGEAGDGGAWLAMELVDGETLEALVRDGPLPPAQAVAVLSQVAEALVAIHGAGLVHCDLSPRNVMVAVKAGRLHVKVLDFGIARRGAMAGAERVLPGEFTGFVNPAFAAPEQLAGQDVDPRADLHSFGALAWWLLTGSVPFDDADPRGTARAVLAGELRAWPGVPGVPRRLRRLVLQCLRPDRQARPANAGVLQRELAAIAGRHRPVVARAALAAAALAAVATALVARETPAPFLRSLAGNSLVLFDRPRGPEAAVQEVTSRQLAACGLHYGGFRAEQLRVHVERAGTVLLRAPLHPEVDPAGEVCTLATAQAEWRAVVQNLASSSRDGAVELSFVVPGHPPLGYARVRVDDEPPQLSASLLAADGGLGTGESALVWQVADGVAVAGVVAVVTVGELPPTAVALGKDSGRRLLADGLLAGDGVRAVGPVTIRLQASDLAGNSVQAEPLSLTACDLRAPAVVAVTGPAGENFLPCIGDQVRLRVRLSAEEPDLGLQVLDGDGQPLAERRLADGGEWQAVDLPRLASGPVQFAVHDRAGNRSVRPFVVAVRDRSTAVQFVPAGGLALVGDELVLADGGASAQLLGASGWRFTSGGLEVAGDEGVPAGVQVVGEAPGRGRVEFGALPPGAHRLRLGLEDVDEPGVHATVVQRLRVLPPRIEVRVPATPARFLPGLLQAGVLAAQGAGYRDGPGWSFDRELRPYLEGAMWVGVGTPVPVPLGQRPVGDTALLPEVLPVPGRNVLALELHDVLGRPVVVRRGNEPAAERQLGDRRLAVVADFWWHDGPPEPVGEEVLVEHGQPARVRLRLPLPYTAADLADLRLGIGPGETAAVAVATGASSAVVTFEVPFATWSVAAQLADRPREAYAGQLEARLRVYVGTPVGRRDLELRLRTTRSTLRAVTWGELADLPPALAALRLVPVLAPEAPFPDPVPAVAPPRALFRPQGAVAVRSFGDFLLLDRELPAAAGRALLDFLPGLRSHPAAAACVHRDDPLGQERLTAAQLLPSLDRLADDEPIVGADFFQAHATCRLLGVALGGDASFCRLPLGCELEVAAYAQASEPACNGPAAHGRPARLGTFLAARGNALPGLATPAGARALGDVVPTPFGADLFGLDFGVREWVADLPYVPAAGLLLAEWVGDHAVHLARVEAFARGTAVPPGDLAAPLRTFGVVRGLATGEVDGLLDGSGRRLVLTDLGHVPASVPGVLRSEQLRRDGRDLLAERADPRLARTGFRVAGGAELLAWLRGRR